MKRRGSLLLEQISGVAPSKGQQKSKKNGNMWPVKKGENHLVQWNQNEKEFKRGATIILTNVIERLLRTDI